MIEALKRLGRCISRCYSLKILSVMEEKIVARESHLQIVRQLHAQTLKLLANIEQLNRNVDRFGRLSDVHKRHVGEQKICVVARLEIFFDGLLAAAVRLERRVARRSSVQLHVAIASAVAIRRLHHHA